MAEEVRLTLRKFLHTPLPHSPKLGLDEESARIVMRDFAYQGRGSYAVLLEFSE